MNENRSIFALDGITGYLIAVVLLLSILAFLTVAAIGAQSSNSTTYYKLDEDKIQRISTDNAKLYHIVKK